MFWFALVILIIATAFAIVNVAKKRSAPNGEYVIFAKYAVPIAYSICILLFIFSSLTIVGAGNVGVSVVLGNVDPTALENGIQFKNPLASIKKMSVRADTYTMSSKSDEGDVVGDDGIQALSSDGMLMPLEVTFAFQLIGSDAPGVFEFIGRDYIQKILRPAARSSVRYATSQFTAHEAYSSKREELQAAMAERMDVEIAKLLAKVAGFEGKGFTVASVLLRDVQLPDKVKNAIEDKLEAEQQSQAMVFVLEKERQEAERKRIEARGIADFQQIVTEGISEPLLRWKGIEATEALALSENAKIVVVGSGKDGLPIILGQ